MNSTASLEGRILPTTKTSGRQSATRPNAAPPPGGVIAYLGYFVIVPRSRTLEVIMAYVLANDPTVDERYVAFSVLVKNMDEKQRALFSRDLTLFSDLRREGLPYRALDALMSMDDDFAVSRAAFYQTMVDFCQNRLTAESYEYCRLARLCEKERKALKKRSSRMVAVANAAIAEYVEYAFQCTDEGHDLDVLRAESLALSQYGGAVRRFNSMLKSLPALPVSDEPSAMQLTASITLGVIALCICLVIFFNL